MYHLKILRCWSKVWVSHYPGEMTIRIDFIQLGKACITRPYELTHHSLGSPFALFKDEFGLSRKARETADARSLRSYLQAWLSPRLSASCSPPRDVIYSPTVLLWMRYLTSRWEQVIRPLCEGTFNLNQGPDNSTVLNRHRRDQRHRPSLPNNDHRSTGSCPVSSYQPLLDSYR
jgi:hypothetical protein